MNLQTFVVIKDVLENVRDQLQISVHNAHLSKCYTMVNVLVVTQLVTQGL